jgi:hypothetical protein
VVSGTRQGNHNNFFIGFEYGESSIAVMRETETILERAPSTPPPMPVGAWIFMLAALGVFAVLLLPIVLG